MKRYLQSQNGFTGIDVSIAIVILFIFTILISTIFVNIYLQLISAQRNATANFYATSISELVDKMYYQDITNESMLESINGMNIANGYTATVQVERYVPEGYTEQNSKDLVKIVTISIQYNVGQATKNISIRRIKSREVFITPNKPKLSSGMVPVKYVVIDALYGVGYWQITTENDTTWYNYDNKIWANIMLEDELIVEGNIAVTDENKATLVGKRVTKPGSVFTWIPRYSNDLTNNTLNFVYSTSESIVDNNGELQSVQSNSISDAFNNKTGFWISKAQLNSISQVFPENVETNIVTNAQAQAVIKLSESIYGNNSNEFNNVSGSRYVITIY